MKREQLVAFCPAAGPYFDSLMMAFGRFGLSSIQRQAPFLGQVHHESGGFLHTVENLNYSAEALRRTWPSRFPDEKTAASYARQPEKIGNHVYANRMGNGDEASGDGWRYRGQGLIQLTGRDNVLAYSKTVYGDDRVLKNPALLQLPTDAVLSAGWFWDSRNLNPLADAADYEGITKRINGGTLGLDDRIAQTRRAAAALAA